MAFSRNEKSKAEAPRPRVEPEHWGGRRALHFARLYPLPTVAAAGLSLGSAATFLFSNSLLGSQVWFLTLVIGGTPVVLKTAKGMLKRRFAADIVAMLAIVSAILLDEAFAGVVIVLMQTGGEALEDYGLGRASSALDALIARAPRKAARKDGATTTVVYVDEVRVGDLLIVKKGDLIPVDGSVVSEAAEVDESALTGEPLPQAKTKGDLLMSGSVNVGGAIEMRAESIARESQYAKIVQLVREAEHQKPRIQRLADRYAVWFTPLTLLVAVLGVVLTSDVYTFLSVLVVATPCPLILATPIAVISGVNRVSTEGIIVKSGAALEQVGGAKVAVFDKTGTITYGLPSVERVIPLGDWSDDRVLFLAAAVEQLSSHPIAASLAEKGKGRFGNLPIPVNFRELPSRGVEGDVEGEHLVVGLKGFCEERIGQPFQAVESRLASDLVVHGEMTTFVAISGRPAGMVVLTDQVRPGMPYMVGRLRELGVQEVVMLTGDNKENAEVVARETGLLSYEANLLPWQKVQRVQNLKTQYGVTIMVGDGINDAPALAAATVGIAMGARGTGISAEAADIVLLVDDVTRVPEAVATGQRMSTIAKQGINFGLGTSFVFMAVASLGFIEPAVGAILQEVIDVLVILNALRVR